MIDATNPLARYRAPASAGAGFAAHRAPGFALIEPLTVKAEAWLRAYADDEATWNGPQLVVELRYFPPVVDAIIAAGFLFERETYLN